MCIESVMTSNHLILCHPLRLLPSIFPSIRVFSNESVLCIRRPSQVQINRNFRWSHVLFSSSGVFIGASPCEIKDAWASQVGSQRLWLHLLNSFLADAFFLVCWKFTWGAIASFSGCGLYFSLIFIKKLFIRLLLAVLRLRCCVWAFSSCNKRGSARWLRVPTSYCNGVCGCRAPALGPVGFRGCSTWTQ